MNITWKELKFFLMELKKLPVSESISLGESGFAVSTGCDIESWVFYPEKINDLKLVEQVINFFKSQKVSFMWPVYNDGRSPAGGEKILEDSGLLYAGDLTGMIYESKPEKFFNAIKSAKINYKDWAKTAWHGFGGELDDVPEKYFSLVKAFNENPKFSLHVHENLSGTFMLVDEPDSTGVYYFATIPEMRRKGIARSMMNEILKLSGGKKILLQATPAGLPFYKNFGFKEICKIPVYSDISDVF